MCENSILQQRLQYFSYSKFENLAFFSEYSSSLNLTSICDKAKPFKKRTDQLYANSLYSSDVKPLF